MLFAIFSDSHGNYNLLKKAVEGSLIHFNPDALVYLGDGINDFNMLVNTLKINDKILITVKGNNDLLSNASDELIHNYKSTNIFITHGHKYGVKYGYDDVCSVAKYKNAQIVLFGHTHLALVLEHNGVYMINPGACNFNSSRYALLEINDKNQYFAVLME